MFNDLCGLGDLVLVYLNYICDIFIYDVRIADLTSNKAYCATCIYSELSPVPIMIMYQKSSTPLIIRSIIFSDELIDIITLTELKFILMQIFSKADRGVLN